MTVLPLADSKSIKKGLGQRPYVLDIALLVAKLVAFRDEAELDHSMLL